jgi:hypothetical protein
MPEDHIIDREIISQIDLISTDVVTVGAAIPADLHAALKSHAQLTDRSMASIIRIALANHLQSA